MGHIQKWLVASALTLSTAVWAAPVVDLTGTYVDRSTGSEVMLLRQGTVYAVSLMAKNGQNMGFANGMAGFKDQRARIGVEDYADCHIEVAVKGSGLQLTQSSSAMDCGFGNNVFADGVYKKTKSSVNFSRHSME